MNKQDKNDLLFTVIGVVLGILLAWATVTIVNQHRFSTRCHERGGVVVKYGFNNSNYCINPDALKEGK